MMNAPNIGRRLAVFGSLLIAPVVTQAAPAETSADSINISGVARGTVTREMQVKIADLNLAERSGQRALEARISYASKQVCDNSGIVGLELRADYQRCRHDARTSAQEQVARVALAERQSPSQLSMR